MKPKDVVKWRQTEPGIWTRVPEDEASAAKMPVRQLPSLNRAPASAGDAPAAWHAPLPTRAARIRT